jgi:hypothetical protein
VGIKWPRIISDTELWEATGQKRVILQIVSEKMAVDRSYTEEEDESIEKQALDWNPQRARRRQRPKETWKRTVLEEEGRCELS